MSVLDLIRADLKMIKGYKPAGNNLPCRLHANELPWSPVTIANVAINHYPDVQMEERLQKQLASYYQINSEQVLLTRGSDDAIDLMMRLFLTPGQNSVLQCPPTFPMYEFYAKLQNAAIINCPLDIESGFSLSIDKLFSLYQPNCKIILLCQPNNPTGNLLDLAVIETICEEFKNKAIVLVDEAYIDFANTESAISLIPGFQNLVVLRTLSKAYGLAGLRLGSVLAQEPLINALKSIMPPYLLPSPILELASQALNNKNWFSTNIAQIIKGREQFINSLSTSPWIDAVYPSHANFVLVKSNKAVELFYWLAQHGIAVRNFAHAPLQDMLRITIGDTAQIQQLLSLMAIHPADCDTPLQHLS